MSALQCAKHSTCGCQCLAPAYLRANVCLVSLVFFFFFSRCVFLRVCVCGESARVHVCESDV